MPEKNQDYASEQTDKALASLEKKIYKEYKQAYEDVKKKSDDFFDQYGSKYDALLAKKNSGEITEEEYTKKINSLVFITKKWGAFANQLAEDLTMVNMKAMSISKSFLPWAYALNHNYAVYELEQDTNIKTSFTLYSAETVERLVKKYKILPDPKVDIPKDLRWNKNHINSAIMQGVLQGEDLEQIATRLRQVTDMDRRASIRNARTAMTGAQNLGRLFAYQKARDLGIKVNKQWLATLDNHTRDSHAKLDGETVPLGKKFSNGLQYPGDAYGDNPAEIYNCRCTMVADVLDFPDDKSVQRYDNIEGKPIQKMTYNEWLAMKEKQAKASVAVKDLEQAEQQLKLLDEKMASENAGKIFSDIWQEDVTYADYEAKKDGIPAKHDYYQEKLKVIEENIGKPDFSQCGGEELAQFLSTVPVTSWRSDTVQEIFHSYFSEAEKQTIIDLAKANGFTTRSALNAYKDLMSQGTASEARQYRLWLKYTRLEKELTEFEINGAKFSKYFSQIEDLKQKIKALKIEAKAGMPISSQFAPDAWDDAVKNKAKLFSSRTEADKYFRKYLDEIWDDLDDQGKYSLWEYTAGSGGLNRPLSGYNGGWDRYNFVGLDKASWKYENKSYSSLDDKSVFYKFTKNGVHYDEAIAGLTKLIDQSSLPDNVWLVRGSDKDGLAGLLEGDLFSFEDAKKLLNKSTKDLEDALVGQSFQNHSFLSTAIAKGSGFGGSVRYEIYAPAGTHAIYAEPQSNYGDTTSRGEMYHAGQRYSSVGSEAEVIFQRGTTFRVTGVENDWGDIKIKMEVVEQPDYFEFGDEDTYNAGATRHKH